MIGSNEIAITIQTILALFGAIAAVMAGISAIAKMLSPFKELKDKIENHQSRLDDGDKRFKKIEEQFESQTLMQKEICKSLLVMMNHSVTGNSIDKLKDQQEELQKFLIDH